MTHEADKAVTLSYIMTSALRDELGMSESDAARIAEDLLRNMSRQVGGSEIYFPKLTELERRKRHERVLRAFNGSNADDVIRAEGISRSTFYKIIADDRLRGRL